MSLQLSRTAERTEAIFTYVEHFKPMIHRRIGTEIPGSCLEFTKSNFFYAPNSSCYLVEIKLTGTQTIVWIVVSMLFAELSNHFTPIFFIHWLACLFDAVISEPAIVPFVLIFESDVVLLITLSLGHHCIAVFGGSHCQNPTFPPFAQIRMFGQDL